MSDPLDPFQRWQRDLAAKMNAESYYQYISVFVFRPREKETATAIQSNIDRALSGLIKKNGKAGLAIHVLMPVGDIPHQEPSGPQFDNSLILRIQEIPEVNMGPFGTMIPVEEAALYTANLFHHFIPGNGQTENRFARDAYTPSLEFAPKLTIDLKLQSRFKLAGPPKVSMPVISGTASAVQLSCNTPGAVIYYTTDHEFPAAVTPTAVRFGEVLETESGLSIVTDTDDPLIVAPPFSVAAGTTIRAAAYKSGTHNGSNVATYTF